MRHLTMTLYKIISDAIHVQYAMNNLMKPIKLLLLILVGMQAILFCYAILCLVNLRYYGPAELLIGLPVFSLAFWGACQLFLITSAKVKFNAGKFWGNVRKFRRMILKKRPKVLYRADGTAKRASGAKTNNRGHTIAIWRNQTCYGNNMGFIFLMAIFFQLGGIYCFYEIRSESDLFERMFFECSVLFGTYILMWFPYHFALPLVKQLSVRSFAGAYSALYQSSYFKCFRLFFAISRIDAVKLKIFQAMTLLTVLTGFFSLIQQSTAIGGNDFITPLYCVSLAIVLSGNCLWIDMKRYFNTGYTNAAKTGDTQRFKFQLSIYNQILTAVIVFFSSAVTTAVICITKGIDLYCEFGMSVILMVNALVYHFFQSMFNKAIASCTGNKSRQHIGIVKHDMF